MKIVVILALLAGAGWAGYDWLNDYMRQENFGSAVEAAIDDPRSRSLETIRFDITAAAERLGIELAPGAIELSVAASDVQPVGGQVVARGGVSTSSRRLTVRVQYDRRLWGAVRPTMVERHRVYVASASAPVGPQQGLLGQQAP